MVTIHHSDSYSLPYIAWMQCASGSWVVCGRFDTLAQALSRYPGAFYFNK